MTKEIISAPNNCLYCNGKSFNVGYIHGAAFIAGDMAISTTLKSLFSNNNALPIKCFRCSTCGNVVLFAGKFELNPTNRNTAEPNDSER